MKEKRLFNDFASSAEAEWLESAKLSLKGAPIDRLLKSSTWEGISRSAIYHRPEEDYVADVPVVLKGGDWLISQELNLESPAEFNRALLDLLSRGQGVVNAKLACGGEQGLKVNSLEDLACAFDGVWADAVAYRFEGNTGAVFLSVFDAWLQSKNADKTKIRGCLGVDPFQKLMTQGQLGGSWNGGMDALSACATHCVNEIPGLRAGLVNTLPLHEGGADAVTELAASLAAGLQLLREMCKRGLSVREAASQIAFTYAIGSDFFMEIAKFRAARLLWASVISELGGNVDEVEMRLHARTGNYNKTLLQAQTNLVRTTSEALSAVIGGVDSLGVGRFDELSEGDADFSRRLAINLQLVLQEECGLGVSDAAKGSYYIESLTEQVSEAAWNCFREMEGQGGFLNSLTSGWLGERLEETHLRKQKSFLQRRTSLVGVNCYPSNDGEDEKGRLQDACPSVVNSGDGVVTSMLSGDVKEASQAILGGANVEEISSLFEKNSDLGPALVSEPLPQRRLAVDCEKIAASVIAPKELDAALLQMTIVRLGEAKLSRPKAEFVKDFFGVGGFHFKEQSVEDELKEVATQVVVICAAHNAAVKEVCETIRALRASRKDLLILKAMKPDTEADDYRAAGVDDFVYRGCDLYRTNCLVLAKLGIEVES